MLATTMGIKRRRLRQHDADFQPPLPSQFTQSLFTNEFEARAEHDIYFNRNALFDSLLTILKSIFDMPRRHRVCRHARYFRPCAR